MGSIRPAWLVLVTPVVAVALAACSQGDAHPSAMTDQGQGFPQPSPAGVPAPPNGAQVPGSTGGGRNEIDGGAATTADAGTVGGIGTGGTTQVGSGNGTGGGISGGAGLGAGGTGTDRGAGGTDVGTGQGTGGGVSGGAGLGAGGTATGGQSTSDAGANVIIVQ